MKTTGDLIFPINCNVIHVVRRVHFSLYGWKTTYASNAHNLFVPILRAQYVVLKAFKWRE